MRDTNRVESWILVKRRGVVASVLAERLASLGSGSREMSSQGDVLTCYQSSVEIVEMDD